jgi:hypothetical protein
MFVKTIRKIDPRKPHKTKRVAVHNFLLTAFCIEYKKACFQIQFLFNFVAHLKQEHQVKSHKIT